MILTGPNTNAGWGLLNKVLTRSLEREPETVVNGNEPAIHRIGRPHDAGNAQFGVEMDSPE